MIAMQSNYLHRKQLATQATLLSDDVDPRTVSVARARGSAVPCRSASPATEVACAPAAYKPLMITYHITMLTAQ
jgi:hypothetical protein